MGKNEHKSGQQPNGTTAKDAIAAVAAYLGVPDLPGAAHKRTRNGSTVTYNRRTYRLDRAGNVLNGKRR